jgi:hypothetical protein
MMLKRLTTILLGVGCMAALAGCSSQAQIPTQPVGTVPYVPAEHAGSVRGQVSWEGDAPAPATIDVRADPMIAPLYPDGKLASDELAIENGHVKNLVVYLRGDTGKWIYPKPETPQRVQVKAGRYEPRTVALRAEQPLTFVAGDEFYNTVLGTPGQLNREFNLGLHKAGDEQTVAFQYAQLGFHVTSDIRKWMRCNVCVFYHPFFAVSDAKGAFEFAHVPDGEYVLDYWHEDPRVQLPPAVSVVVKGGTVEQSIVLRMKPPN